MRSYDIMEETDIVVTTYLRESYLRKTLQRIRDTTRAPYRLHVIDDGTKGEKLDYLVEEYHAGRIQDLVLRAGHRGAMANLNIGEWLSFSNPVVFTDDDVLCPNVDPDWLSRGLYEMRAHPECAMIALRHPGAKVKPTGKKGNVVYCKSLGGTFCFVRREFLTDNPLPHRLNNFAKPMEVRCGQAHAAGWKIGFISGLYCYHIGEHSVLTDSDYKGRFIEPEDWDTLKPPGEYAD